MKLLKRKRAADPGGWTTELWMLSWDDQQQRDRLLTWLQRICAPTASPEIKHLLSLTQLIMISKSSGGTRPILLISLFKKIYHAVIAQAAGPDLHALTDAEQFGHQQQGTLLLLAAAEGHKQRYPHDMIMQLDIRNAFGSLRRDQALLLLHNHLSDAARTTWYPLLAHVLSTGTTIVHPHQCTEMTVTHDGIPQGDPLSALVFSSVICLIFRQWAASAAEGTRSPHHETRKPMVASYVDDTLIGGSIQQIPSLLSSLRTHLIKYGLHLQAEKTRIWVPEIARGLPDTMAALQRAQLPIEAVTAGLTICGQAFSDDTDLEIPLGDDAFLKQWLDDKTRVLEKKLRKLQSLPLADSPESPLVQTGILILRAMWPGSINHLLRSLPAPLTRSWVESLQPLMDETLAQLAGLPLLSHAQDKLRSLPISKGGLAMPDLGDLAMTARLAALATIPGHPNAADYKRKCIEQEAADLALGSMI